MLISLPKEIRQWEVNKTRHFKKCCDKLRITQKVIESTEDCISDVNLVQSKKFRLYFRSPTNKFEIWNAKLPDPDYKKGTQGGFRLICYFIKEDKIAYLHYIERRGKLGDKKRPREQKVYEEMLRSLKEKLTKNYG